MSKVLAVMRRHAIAFAALFLVLGSASYAVAAQSGPPAQKRIYACVTHEYSTLNLSSAEHGCPAGQHKISWAAEAKAGARGPAGPVGKTGGQGATGTTGAAGTTGATGATGSKGETGARGEMGAKGEPGLRGEPGLPGEPGVQGDPGPQGDTGPQGVQGPQGDPGANGHSQYAEFYALMPPDNSATIAPGDAVEFPEDGPSSATIVRQNASSFVLPNIGTYRVSFNVSVEEEGQLELSLNTGAGAVDLPYTVFGRATGTSQIVGEALVTSTVINSVISVIAAPGNFTALTLDPLAGGGEPVAASLIIEQLR
jgi:Collagen triple helix repeat (20 copies)